LGEEKNEAYRQKSVCEELMNGKKYREEVFTETLSFLFGMQ